MRDQHIEKAITWGGEKMVLVRRNGQGKVLK